MAKIEEFLKKVYFDIEKVTSGFCFSKKSL